MGMRDKFIEIKSLSRFKKNKAGRVSVLNISVSKGYPRLSVNINDADEGVKGVENMIITPFNFTTIYDVVEALRTIVDEPIGTSINFKCMNVKRDATKELYHQGTLTIGKSPKGICYIKLAKEGAEPVTFPLVLVSKYHIIVDDNGQESTYTPYGSKVFTRSYAGLMERELHAKEMQLRKEDAEYKKEHADETLHEVYVKKDDVTETDLEDLLG